MSPRHDILILHIAYSCSHILQTHSLSANVVTYMYMFKHASL